MPDRLSNKRVAFLATNGVEPSEMQKPWEALQNEGAETVLISLEKGEIFGLKKHTEKQGSWKVDQLVSEADASDFDALVIPGGLANPDTMRANKDAVQFVKDFFEQKKPVAAICHGPWLLAEADVLKGRKVTSYPNIKTDIKNAGADWVDEEVVVDKGLVTSRKPDDLDAFCKKTIEEIAEGKHAKQAA